MKIQYLIPILFLAAFCTVSAQTNNGPIESKTIILTPSDKILGAAYSGDWETIKALLKANPELIDSNKYGMKPLHIAVKNNRTNVAEWMLAHGGDVNAKTLPQPPLWGMGDNSLVETPMILAIEARSKEMVALLLAHNADLNIRSNSWPPLHLAADLGLKDIAELLLAHGADINATNGVGETPLHYAARSMYPGMSDGYKDMVELLLAHGAYVNARDKNGWTPLHNAAYFGRNIVVESPLTNNADASAKANNGKKPLNGLNRVEQIADKEVVASLLAHGADVNATNAAGQTPLHLALTWKHNDEVVNLLRQQGGHE